MKKILLIGLVVTFFGCKNKSNEMVDAVKKYYTDAAFANNSTIKFYNCDLIQCDTINENIFDTTYKVNVYLNKIESFTPKMKNVVDEMHNEVDMMKIQAMAGNKDVVNYLKDKVDDLGKKLHEYKDSSDKYSSIVDTIFAHLKPNPEPVYKLKMYIKASANTNGKIDNIIDTIPIFLDKNLNVKKLS